MFIKAVYGFSCSSEIIKLAFLFSLRVFSRRDLVYYLFLIILNVSLLFFIAFVCSNWKLVRHRFQAYSLFPTYSLMGSYWRDEIALRLKFLFSTCLQGVSSFITSKGRTRGSGLATLHRFFSPMTGVKWVDFFLILLKQFTCGFLISSSFNGFLF